MTSEGTIRDLAIRTDTALAALYRKANEVGAYLHSDCETLRFYEDKKNRSFDAERRIPELKASIAERRAQIAAIKAEMAPLEAIFEQHKWTRAFLVITSGRGHVHRSMTCSTCFPTTVFDWRPEYSGANESQIVEDAGERACTVCYPSAPVEVLARPSRIFSDDERTAQAAREERAIAKAARDAKRAAKAPTASGQPLTITEVNVGFDGKVHTYRRDLATEITAGTEYRHMAETLGWKKDAAEVEAIRVAMSLIETSLAEKHGVTVEAERARLLKRRAS